MSIDVVTRTQADTSLARDTCPWALVHTQKDRWLAKPKIAPAIDVLKAISAGDEVFLLLAAVTQHVDKERLSVKLASKTACDSCASLPLAIIERRVERQMHVCLSNNVAEEMTNDTATVLSTDNCGDSVTLYGRTGWQRSEYLRRGDKYLVPINFHFSQHERLSHGRNPSMKEPPILPAEQSCAHHPTLATRRRPR